MAIQVDIVPIFSGVAVRNGAIMLGRPPAAYQSGTLLEKNYATDMYFTTWAYPPVSGTNSIGSEYAGRMQTNYIVTSGVSSGIEA